MGFSSKDLFALGVDFDYPTLTEMERLITAERMSVEDSFRLALKVGIEDVGWSPGTQLQLGRLMKRFIAFAAAHEVHFVDEVDQNLVTTFVNARNPGPSSTNHKAGAGEYPAVGTRYNRRGHLRMYFVILQELGVIAADPTARLSLPHKQPGLPGRPLHDYELELLKFRLSSVRAPRAASAVAFAEAGAVTSEIAELRVRDIDFASGTVALAGCHAARPRIGHLSAWGLLQVERRMRGLAPNQQLFVNAAKEPRDASTKIAAQIGAQLRRCGLFGADGVTSTSVRATAGLHAFLGRRRIEDAAIVLGTHTLDMAARYIRFDWQTGTLAVEPTADE